MGKGPLDHPRLLAIEKKLDDGELDEAQHLLAQLGDVGFFRFATTYLATRLLFQRGRLEPRDVADRLRELLKAVAYFPEAAAMLQAAESGTLQPGGGFKRASIAPSVPSGAGAIRAPTPQIEVGPATSVTADMLAEPAGVVLPSIPRAAPVPQFTPPPDHPLTALEAVAPAAVEPEEVVIRSGPPPKLAEGVPLTLFEIAALLDGGEPERALLELERAADTGAEAVLMRARALARLGRAEEALPLLARLASAPLLDPEIRAGVARLLIELGRHARALEQARKAHDDDPEPLMVRLTLAWAALRSLRHGGDPRLTELAEGLLARMRSRTGPRPQLVLALRAALAAPEGDAERAIVLAQRALKLDPRAADALAALAIASARLARVHDARQAWIRLLDVNADEARAITAELGRHDVDVASIDPRERPGQSLTGDDAVWEPVELALLEGRRRHTIVALESLCKDTLADVAAAKEGQLAALGTVAASFFTSSPVFRDFAPWDLSLWSVARLDAALAVLYGGEPRSTLESDDYSLQILAGSYLGETLRQAHAGSWSGGLANMDRAAVSTDDGEWRPFRLVRARIRDGAALGTDASLAGALAHPGSDPWLHRLPCPAAPPCPWDPDELPDPTRIDAIGRALSRSVIGSWCQRSAEGPLDRSLASLAALDSYLALVAPQRAPRDRDEPWIRRVGVLAGAYLGEVLRSAAGGEWVRGNDDETTGPGSYHVLLGTNAEAAPIEHALSRITEHGIPLSEYAARLVRGIARAD